MGQKTSIPIETGSKKSISMGQKTSTPLETDSKKSVLSSEFLEYNDNIIYVNEQNIVLHDTNYDAIIKILPTNIESQHTHQNRQRTRIASVGTGLIVVIDLYDEEYAERREFTIIDEKLECIKSVPIFRECLGRYTGRPGNIDEFITEKVEYINSLRPNKKNPLLDRSQLKRLFPKDVSHAVKLEMKDGIIKLNNELCVFESRDIDWDILVAVTYSQYSDILVTCVDTGFTYILMTWRRDDNKIWKLDCTSHIIKSFAGAYAQIFGLESSRKHLFVDTNVQGQQKILVLDINTLIERYRISGCHPVYRDYYAEWFEKNMELLKSVKIMEKITINILSIMLSYVD